MTISGDPKYDTDAVNLGYLNKILNNERTETEESNKQLTKNFNSPPNPPYYVGWTYTNGDKIYHCVKERLMGAFHEEDWVLTYDKKQNDLIKSNFIVLSEIDIPKQSDGKIESFYQEDDPS